MFFAFYVFCSSVQYRIQLQIQIVKYKLFVFAVFEYFEYKLLFVRSIQILRIQIGQIQIQTICIRSIRILKILTSTVEIGYNDIEGE